MQVARRIAELRSSLGVTQEELASRLGIALKNLQRIEAGQNLTLRSIERIARALGIEAIDLFARPVRRPVGRGRKKRRSAASRLEGLAETEAVVLGLEAEPPPNAIPVTTLRAAAGRLREAREVEALAWALLPGRRPPAGSFLARVVGRSMEPRLPDGSWALFRAPAQQPLEGKVALVARGVDDRQEEAFLLKKVAEIRPGPDEASTVTLTSYNPAYPPIEIEIREERDLRAVADLVRVLGPRMRSRGA